MPPLDVISWSTRPAIRIASPWAVWAFPLGGTSELFRYLEGHGCKVAKAYEGIYYVEGKTWFPTQIVVTGELDQEAHIWLKGLSGNLEKGDIQKMMDERNHMTEKADRELADSVLEVSISANRKIVEELIGDESMYEALMEIMEQRIKQREDAKTIKTIRRKGNPYDSDKNRSTQ